jgi:hypothetical protein
LSQKTNYNQNKQKLIKIKLNFIEKHEFKFYYSKKIFFIQHFAVFFDLYLITPQKSLLKFNNNHLLLLMRRVSKPQKKFPTA